MRRGSAAAKLLSPKLVQWLVWLLPFFSRFYAFDSDEASVLEMPISLADASPLTWSVNYGLSE